MAKVLASAALTLLLIAQMSVALSARGATKHGNTARTSGEFCSALDSVNCEATSLMGCAWDKGNSRCVRSQSASAGKFTATAEASGSNTPPTVPLPWTTTQQRTHTFENGVEFLSIAEEQSQRMTNDGFTQAAFYIFPATPFSLREGNGQVIKGMRGVFTTNPSKGAGWIQRVLWFQNMTGPEYCVQNMIFNRTVDAIIPSAPHNQVIRGNGDWGVPVERYTTYYQTAGTVTMDYVTENRGGPYANGTGTPVKYPLRKIRDYGGSSPGQKGYMLDQGQHFPVAIDSWFDMSNMAGCPSPAFAQDASPAVHPDGAFELNSHVHLIKRNQFLRN